jgi:hypothetical protein
MTDEPVFFCDEHGKERRAKYAKKYGFFDCTPVSCKKWLGPQTCQEKGCLNIATVIVKH